MFVCAKYFEKKYLIPNATGKICGKTTRDYVTLSQDAVPTIFAHLSRYQTGNIPMKRKSHEEREQEKMNAKKIVMWNSNLSRCLLNGYFSNYGIRGPVRIWKIDIPYLIDL